MRLELTILVAIFCGFIGGIAFQMKVHTPAVKCIDYQNAEFQAVQREVFKDAYYFGAQALYKPQCETFQEQLTQDSINYFKIIYGN